MQRKQIKLDEIEPAYGYGYHNPGLVKRIQEIGWEGIPPLPVIEIPERLRVNGKRYSHCDGHHRHNAAIITKEDTLDCIIYDGTDNIAEVSLQTGDSCLMDYSLHLKYLEEELDRRSRDGI